MSNNPTEKARRFYNRAAGAYDFVEAPLENGMQRWRRELLDGVHGNILEVGVGTGKNLPWYPAQANVTAIDLSEGMLKHARQRREVSPANISLYPMDVQDLDFPDNHFETVVSTMVFCTVPDPLQGLQEIHRVLRPGGRLLMIEHVRSHRPVLGKIMDWLNPVFNTLIADNINRDTVSKVEEAGFRDIDVNRLKLDVMVKIEAWK